VSERVSELETAALWAANAHTFCVGRIIRITTEGRVWVDFPGNAMGPAQARSIVDISQNRGEFDDPVLLLFEGGDPTLPIIVGIVRDTLRKSLPAAAYPGDAVLDGKRITLVAQHEILLRCGKSSILLRKDGKIVVKGAQIVSRSSGPHKIRGASVNIN
jgi:hypothetical protein